MRLALSLVLAGLAVLAGLTATAGLARAESLPTQVVQNDDYTFGQTPAFPSTSGLNAGDAMAARLRAFGGSSAVIEVMVVFGGITGGGQFPVTLKIWDDTAQSDAPGPELFSMPFVLDNAALVLQSIPLAGVGVPERFRVGIVLGAAAPPLVAHDTDGTIAADNNFTFRTGSGWRKSQADGVTGDWIIHARLAGSGGGGGSGSNGGGACFGVDCPAGQFCDMASRACTFECRTADDCGGAFCNSNGQCVGEGSGCCETGGGGGPAAGLLGLGVLALVLRRRR